MSAAKAPRNGRPLNVVHPPDSEQKLPPQDLEAEGAVIGGLLMGYDLAEIRAMLRPDDFYVDRHQILYRGILAMADEGQPIDPLILADRLKADGQLERIGGDTAIGDVMESIPHTANTSYYTDIILEKARARDLMEGCERIIRDLYKGREPVETIAGRLNAIRSRALASGQGGTVRLSEVEPKALRWLWPNRVPMGKLTTFAGPGGIGKTYVSLYMAACVTKGTPWPDCPDAPNPAGSVVLISTEDDLEDTTVPRLIAQGADLDKIHTLAPAELGRFTLADLAPLERAIREAGDARLVIIDPPTAHLGQTDEHKNSQLRALLAPLAELAARYNVAIILITHVNKSNASGSANRVIGSVAWTNAVRAAWLFKKDPDDKARRLLLPIKANLAPETTGLAYRIVKPAGKVEWEDGTIPYDADEACEAESRDRTPNKVDRAGEWLVEFLAGGPRLNDKIFEAGTKAGFTRDNIYKAKKARNIQAKRTGYQGDFHWGIGDPSAWVYPTEEEIDFGDPPQHGGS